MPDWGGLSPSQLSGSRPLRNPVGNRAKKPHKFLQDPPPQASMNKGQLAPCWVLKFVLPSAHFSVCASHGGGRWRMDQSSALWELGILRALATASVSANCQGTVWAGFSAAAALLVFLALCGWKASGYSQVTCWQWFDYKILRCWFAFSQILCA